MCEKVERQMTKFTNKKDEALGNVLETFRRYLLAIARRSMDPALLPKAGASDLVQETLLEAQRDYDSFRGDSDSDMQAWLRRLLLNNVSNFHRRYRGAAKRSVFREMAIDAASPQWGSDDDSDDPAHRAEDLDQKRLLRQMIARLTGDHSRVLTLWYEERSFEEIGIAMNRSTDAARMLWLRAVERLKEQVEKIV